MKIRTGVIGTGYLGKFHLQKYNNLEDSELIGLAEIDPVIAENLSRDLCIEQFSDYNELLDHVDAVSIVTPTQSHYEIAKKCLERGIHILLEKPVTISVQEINDLIDIAEKNNCIIQAGHIERYNPAYVHLAGIVEKPLMINAVRTCLYKKRGTEVSVIFDMMIHDIDLVLNLFKGRVKHISATGTTLLSDQTDYANATLVFEDGNTANIIASRISDCNSRVINVITKDQSITTDLTSKEIHITEEINQGSDYTRKINAEHPDQDAMFEEIKDFLSCIKNGMKPVVSGETGRDALDLALKIEHCIQSNE